MSSPNAQRPATPPTPAARRSWEPPQVTDLPRLTELTLQTGSPIPGGGNTGGGGGGVIP